MTLNLISLGLNENSLTAEALQILKSSDKIYLENYTVNFPYKIEDLEKNYNIKITKLNRNQVESEQILKEAKEKNISLLIYGDALSATTHIQFLTSNTQTLKHSNTQTLDKSVRIYHNASILTAIGETGLSLYKFGKTTSMPNWKEHTNCPKSFASYIKQNQSIQAHTLILTDIDLNIQDAINQLKRSCDTLPEKIIAISNAGTKNQKIFYDTPDNLTKEKIKMPFCLIIPSELSHIEEEMLEKVNRL